MIFKIVRDFAKITLIFDFQTSVLIFVNLRSREMTL